MSGCSSEDSLCECVEAGESVNQLSSSFFDGSYSEERKDSLAQAIDRRDELCAPFQNMGPQELQEASKECVSLKIETGLE
jgi:hypothetical protein